MPAKNPRINAVVEEPIYEAIEKLAQKDGVSISHKTRDLLLDSLERIEDVKLAEIAEERKKETEFISHEVLKNRLDFE